MDLEKVGRIGVRQRQNAAVVEKHVETPMSKVELFNLEFQHVKDISLYGRQWSHIDPICLRVPADASTLVPEKKIFS